MSEAKRELGAAPGEKSKTAPNCYVLPFDLADASQALQSLFPPGTAHARLTAFFANRPAFRTVIDWRRGRRKPPQWALDMLEAYGLALVQCARRSEPGNKERTGTEALRRHRLEKRAKSLQQ